MTSGAPEQQQRQLLLPRFALFLLEHHLDQVAAEAHAQSRELHLPMLQYLAMADFQMEDVFRQSFRRLLQSLAEGTEREMTKEELKRWMENQLPLIASDRVAAEDISIAAEVRKRVFLRFLPRFTTDTSTMISIIHEIDAYILFYLTQSFSAYSKLLHERIQTCIDDLHKSDNLFRHAQAVTRIGTYVWNLADNRIEWSEELYRIYGIDPSHKLVSGGLARTYNHPDDQRLIDEHVTRSIETGEPFNFFYRITVDGQEKILQARGEVEYGEDGKPARLFGTAQDVTERQRLLERLQESERRYKQSQALAHLGNWSWDIEGNEVEWTDEMYRIYGLEQAPGTKIDYETWLALVHPDDRERSAAETKKSLATKQPNEYYFRILLRDGVVKIVHTKSEVVLNEDGTPRRLMGTTQDVTLQKQIEEELIKKSYELQQSNQSLEEFAFIASHDLKEPLRKISTLADRLLIAERLNLTTDGQVYLQKIIGSAIRMQQMIDDLLSLAQVSADRSFRRTDLQAILGDVLQMFEQKIEETRATVTCAGLPHAVVVVSQFRQLFQNLISNSLKFSKSGVSPHISITHEYLSPPSLPAHNLQPADRYLQITFVDNGIGFDNRFLTKIFSIFQRLHARNQYEGTGIGLSICRKIVENHGGVILATGEPGQGAEFRIIVPDHGQRS